MDELVLAKIKAAKATQIADCCQLQEGQALLQAEYTPAQFLQVLIAAHKWADALRFLAHGLPKREAVWWAYVCVQSVAIKPMIAEAALALQAVKQWVYEPSEANRRSAQAAADRAGHDQPASWAALAAFWSEGSLTPPDAPLVAPGPNLTGHAVLGALMLAAAQEPKHIEQHYQQFLKRAIHIANGGDGLLESKQ